MASIYNHVSVKSKNKCAKQHIPNTPATTVTNKKFKCEFGGCNGSFSTTESRNKHYNNIHNWSTRHNTYMNNGRTNDGKVCKPRKIKQIKITKKSAQTMAKDIKKKQGTNNHSYITSLSHYVFQF